MEPKQEPVFVDGMIYRDPPKGAPDFVLGKISIRVVEFLEFVKKYQGEDGWLNLEVKRGKSQKPYVQLNTWKKSTSDDVPF